MPWPRHPLLFLAALMAIIATPRYIPQLHDWRLFDWSTVGRVLDLGITHDGSPLLYFRGQYGRLHVGE